MAATGLIYMKYRRRCTDPRELVLYSDSQQIVSATDSIYRCNRAHVIFIFLHRSKKICSMQQESANTGCNRMDPWLQQAQYQTRMHLSKLAEKSRDSSSAIAYTAPTCPSSTRSTSHEVVSQTRMSASSKPPRTLFSATESSLTPPLWPCTSHI